MQILPQEATKEELEAMERAKKAIKVRDVLAEQAQCEDMMPDAGETMPTNRQLMVPSALATTDGRMPSALATERDSIDSA